MTGIVLPFPTGRAEPITPETRLGRALERLTGALAEQHAALCAWRDALQDLKTANDKLQASLGGYANEMDRLGAGIDRLDSEARRLQAYSA